VFYYGFLLQKNSRILIFFLHELQYNIVNIVHEFLNKTKTIALSTLKFWQQVCFIINDMYAKYYAIIKMVSEKTWFLALLKNC
jgi:hypothetical protein